MEDAKIFGFTCMKKLNGGGSTVIRRFQKKERCNSENGFAPFSKHNLLYYVQKNRKFKNTG